jgi:hypothetical protein
LPFGNGVNVSYILLKEVKIMCDFISWKVVRTADGGMEILFLTYDDIYNTKRGKELQKYTIPNDFVGHGAIDFYYGLNGRGTNKECTDFSSPDNFPSIIADAIKMGKFYLMGTPEGLLLPSKRDPLYADYEAKCAPLDADYKAKRDPLYADYEAKCAPLDADYKAKRALLDADYKAKRDPLYEDYEAKRAPLDADYEAKCALLDADYKAKRDPLDADYKAKRDPLYADYKAKRALLDADYEAKFWELFFIIENRASAWR